MYYAAIFAGLPARRGPSVDDGAGPGYTAAMAPSRLIPILVLLAAAACENALPTGGPACPHDEFLDRQVPFNVVVSSVPTLVRRDLDIEALSRIRNAERLGPGKLQGLTVVEHRLGYNTGVAVAKGFLRPRSCAWLESLTVDLTPGEVTIYVPREYAEGSCEDTEILRHERQHEDIHRRGLEESAEETRRALARAKWLPARGTPLEVAGRAEAERRLDEMVLKVIQPEYDQFKERLEKEQAVIDLPENYQWVTRRCPGWK